MSANPLEVRQTPTEIVYDHYNFPFNPRPFQREAIDEMGWLDRVKLFHDPGLGKTFSSTAIALLKKVMGEADTALVIMPPILIHNWSKFLGTIKSRHGKPLKVLAYQGSPAERSLMDLKGHDFVLVSLQIFKKDYERFDAELGNEKVYVILDEAVCVKNVGTDNYKKFRGFTIDKNFSLLTGTPLTTPADAYAYVKLTTPTVYRNQAQFNRIHIEEKDFFGNPVTWRNLELMQENLALNASFARKEDVLKDLPSKNVIPLEYELDPAHLKLYRKLVDAQLLQLPDGQKIDATQAQALRHALGRIVLSWDHFSGDPSKVAKGFDLIDEVMEEIGDEKLIVFANYRMSNRAIIDRFQKYGAVGVYGDISDTDKPKNIAKFINDPKVRLITLQPRSAGVGVDGLQEVCSNCIFIEPPSNPAEWNQALSRLWRDGQTKITNVRMAVAAGTVQYRTVLGLIDKEELVNPIQYTKAELRGLLLGE